MAHTTLNLSVNITQRTVFHEKPARQWNEIFQMFYSATFSLSIDFPTTNMCTILKTIPTSFRVIAKVALRQRFSWTLICMQSEAINLPHRRRLVGLINLRDWCKWSRCLYNEILCCRHSESADTRFHLTVTRTNSFHSSRIWEFSPCSKMKNNNWPKVSARFCLPLSRGVAYVQCADVFLILLQNIQ